MSGVFRLGFTGTREGMTPEQMERCRIVLAGLNQSELHHGDCVGADADMHAIARFHGVERIVSHPSTFGSLRAYCAADFTCQPLPPLTRNAIIARECHTLIATPREDHQPRRTRSGTWHTVRYAREIRRDVMVVWPDGTLELTFPVRSVG